MRKYQQVAITTCHYRHPESGDSVAVMGLRVASVSAIRQMNAEAIRRGFPSPIDPRLLITLSPREWIMVSVANSGMPSAPDADSDPIDPNSPVEVGVLLQYPTARRAGLLQTLGVVAQFRLVDVWHLPAAVKAVVQRADGSPVADGARAEEEGDMPAILGLSAAEATPFIRDSQLLREWWQRRHETAVVSADTLTPWEEMSHDVLQTRGQ